MRVRCTNRELTEEQRSFLKASSRFRPNHRLSVGKESLVVGLIGVIDSPQYGNTTLFQIVNDDRQFVIFPAILFEVTDARCSSFWKAAIQKDGTVTLRPEELNGEYFAENLSEGDPATRRVFDTMVVKLEAEFPALVAQP